MSTITPDMKSQKHLHPETSQCLNDLNAFQTIQQNRLAQHNCALPPRASLACDYTPIVKAEIERAMAAMRKDSTPGNDNLTSSHRPTAASSFLPIRLATPSFFHGGLA
eukprot:CAMPEP_0167741882 /NCGR_PEP_ID=MMETSP0110_2-20121227/1106_1 /TAXON_ID=629695 /ORGANISM="Gymnochlora sp., Strain CCMP2014" /LENGTH=107 /DNA_ID=CAMNT_0007625989 /DNA_START=1653 /DNA_END=1972 /DNA_ORIENTATION=+